MMNQNTNNGHAMTLAAAIAALTEAITALTTAATTEATATTAETTATTEVASTTPVIVLDDDDSVIGVGFKGSMIEQDPMDPMPSAKTAKAAEDAAQKITDETAAEANAVADTEKMLDDIIADISALYNISSYALSNEGKNIESDRSPYAPKENKMGVIGDYQVFIAKEVIKDCDHVTGSFRLIIKDKTIVTPIMELELRLIDGHYKVFSSENTHRMEKMKEDHDLMRFLEITEEVSALIMSRYLAD